MPADLHASMLLLLATAVLLVVAEGLTRYTPIAPEYSRKLVHAGAGLACLFFPFLFQNTLTILVLALLIGSVMYLAERRQWLQCLCRVTRKSKGSLYYPVAIAGLFYLTRDAYRLYASAVLVLTVADSAAALVGARWGRIRYRTGEAGQSKSLEGSVAFWLLAFLAVFIPLLWPQSPFDLMTACLSAFLAASLLTFVEAAATGGIDNLYIPILTAFFLIKMADKSTPELVMQSVSMVLLFALLALVNRFGRMLRSRELITMTIFVYGTWSLGSVDWAIPMIAAFAIFAILFNLTGSDQRRTWVNQRMVRLSLPAAMLILTANLTGYFAFLYASFLMALLVPASWGSVMQLRKHTEQATASLKWCYREAVVALLVTVGILAQPVLTGRAPDATAALILVALALSLTWLGIGLMHAVPIPPTAVAVTATCLAALMPILLQWYGLTTPWQPSRWDHRYQRDMEILVPLPSPSPANRSPAP